MYTTVALAISERISICPKCGALNEGYRLFCERGGNKTLKGSKFLRMLELRRG
ncbi:MAG: hypothetical protein ACXQTZ_05255 [Candidatus Alkanophagales archaeon]